MERLKMRLARLFATAGIAAALAAPALAKTVEVKMLNQGSQGGFMVFEPAFVKIAPGDSVSFVATTPGHDVVSLPDMAPAGAPAFAGKPGQPLTVKFAAEGLYGYKCSPHVSMGMVGLIQVGKPTNKAQAAAGAAKLPGLAKTKMTGLLATAR
jgi:pseudoazurin